MHKVFNKTVPVFIQEKFANNNHKYSTQFSADTYKLDEYNTNIYNKFSFTFSSPFIWNYFVTVHPGITGKPNPVFFVKKILLSDKQIDLW